MSASRWARTRHRRVGSRGAAWHDRLRGSMVVGDENGVDMCSGYVASLSRGVHDFVKVADCELCRGIVQISRCQKQLAAARDRPDATERPTDGNQLWVWLSPPCSERMGKPMLGGELRRKEHLLSRARVCGERFGAYDDMSEGFCCLPLSPTSGKTEIAHEARSSTPDSTHTR
jgi:hypothetical protein